MYDLELLAEMGFCPGIENYSRHLTGRAPGDPPPTLLDYFPKDSIFFVDESHVTMPQIGGMYRGDRSRKKTLVDFGFRLPSALDNRPLNFEEWERHVNQAVYVSATPGDYELQQLGRACRRAAHPPDGTYRSADRSAQGRHAGGRSARGDSQARRGGRARARHLPDEEDGRGSDRLLPRPRHPRALSAFGHRNDRAGRDYPRIAQRRLRRAGRDQPAARRTGPARGLAGRDSRRRQGRLSALGALADPDDRARGAKSARAGPHVRGSDDGLDGEGYRRDRSAPRQAARLQRGQRHHPGDDHQGDRSVAGRDVLARVGGRAGDRRQAERRRDAARARVARAHQRAAPAR